MRTVTEIKRNREEILGFKIDGVCEEKFSLAKGVKRNEGIAKIQRIYIKEAGEVRRVARLGSARL